MDILMLPETDILNIAGDTDVDGGDVLVHVGIIGNLIV